MNFSQRYTAATKSGDMEDIRELEAMAWDLAYERACELDSSNSPDFDALHERIYEELLS